MKQDKFRVTCLECKEYDIITCMFDGVNHQVTDYIKKLNTPFNSFRWRPDQKWGFYCKCGNDNRLAPQEADNFDNLVKGDEMSLKRIIESLLIPDEQQFRMETV